MPTKRVRDSERKRCAQACESCKQRKQRCDGQRPCRRCVRRGVGRDCQSSATRYPLLASSLPSPDPDHFRRETPPGGPDAERMSPGDHIRIDADAGQPTPSAGQLPSHAVSNNPLTTEASPSDRQSTSSHLLSSGFPTRVPQMSRLVKDTKGQYMFIGDSATLSFLQNIRRIVRKSLGTCPFVDDPLRHLIVESSPDAQRGWLMTSAQNPPPKQTPEEVEYLQRWYMQSANCVLLLFCQDELARSIKKWQENGCDKSDPASPVYYLIFAIGAQTGPEDKDELAEVFFNYARYLTVESLMEDPDIPTIQTFALITMYLLGASRRNSAFMYLGMGVRAAYALGLHRKDISALFPPAECRARERLWKAIRILDLFMSASLGRPPSTAETRETASKEDYSACNDLSMIFESVLSQIYAKRMISTEVIERISQHHRRWSAQSQEGFNIDGIESGELLSSPDDPKRPNMGLLNLKQTAFWTIILLSFPFLLREVSANVDANPNSAHPGQDVRAESSSNQVLVYACLEAAIHNVDMLQSIFTTEHVPKRLPFVINSSFVSGLVLGVATFGDFDVTFPIERSLRLALTTLSRFSIHDAVAKRHLVILEHLQGACDKYLEMRARWKMQRQTQLVGGLFGSIHSIGVPNKTKDNLNGAQNERDATGSSRATPNLSAPGLQTPALDVDPIVAQHQQDEEMAANFSDLIPAISPSFLWFDTFGEIVPLYPTVDAGMVDMNASGPDADIRSSVNYNEFVM